MKLFWLIGLTLMSWSCLKELDVSEVVRDNEYDPNADQLPKWYKPTGKITPINNLTTTYKLYHFQCELLNQMIIDEYDEFFVVFDTYGPGINEEDQVTVIYLENGRYLFDLRKVIDPSVLGAYCFEISYKPKGAETGKAYYDDCWSL